MSVIILLFYVDAMLCSMHLTLCDLVIRNTQVFLSFYTKVLVNFSFKNTDIWLFHSEICHFDVKSMETNARD
jgi:hypothetical protein